MERADDTRVLSWDLRGQICPSTLLVALKAMNSNRSALRSGTLILRFLLDNRDATVTIPEAAENMGYGCSVRREGAAYGITIAARGTPGTDS